MGEKPIRASIDDLYNMAFIKLLLPYLDLKAVNIQRDEIILKDGELLALSQFPGVEVRSWTRGLTCEIPVNAGHSTTSMYSLAVSILYACSIDMSEVREKRLRQEIYGSLRALFDRDNKNKEAQEVILEIIFQLGKRGYMDLILLLDALLEDSNHEISGEIIVEIEQMIALTNPEGTDVKKKFEL